MTKEFQKKNTAQLIKKIKATNIETKRFFIDSNKIKIKLVKIELELKEVREKIKKNVDKKWAEERLEYLEKKLATIKQPLVRH